MTTHYLLLPDDNIKLTITGVQCTKWNQFVTDQINGTDIYRYRYTYSVYTAITKLYLSTKNIVNLQFHCIVKLHHCQQCG